MRRWFWAPLDPTFSRYPRVRDHRHFSVGYVRGRSQPMHRPANNPNGEWPSVQYIYCGLAKVRDGMLNQYQSSIIMGSISRSAVYVVDPYHDVAVSRLRKIPDIELVLPQDPRIRDYLEQATIVMVRSETIIDAKAITQASPRLKCIIKQGVGVDNIDILAAREKGIKVYNTPGMNGEAVAELTIALTMCVGRRLCEFDRKIRNGEQVVRSQMLGKSLFRKTIGIVGMGNIGFEVAKKWRGAMSGNVIAFDPFSKAGAWLEEFPSEAFTRAQSLEELLEAADIVTLHMPLTESTRGLIGEKQFGLMRKGAILLNCARGGIVDEAALLRALDADHIYGAGLDAALYEPPTLSAYGTTLLQHPRVVMTPHVGASTAENQEASGLAVVAIAEAILSGNASKVPRPVV